jgi:hypothetical protein
MMSRANDIRSRLAEVDGDARATWRIAQKLLHSKPAVYQNDAESASLSAAFSQFFIEKVSRIWDNIASTLLVLSVPCFEIRKHVGNNLSVFKPVTNDDVRRVLSRIPSKSSPLDAVPTTLLKSCSEIFVPVIVRLAKFSFSEGRFRIRYKKAQVMPLLKKPGLDNSLPENYRPISNLNTI